MSRWITEMPAIPKTFKRRWKTPTLLRDKRDGMFDLVPDLCETVVEVGSQWGWWAERAALNLRWSNIYCVDPWSNDPASIKEWKGGESNFFEWALNVEPWLGKRITGIRGTSKEVAPEFVLPIDFLFIDGDHHEDKVLIDLRCWVPKVRPGGLIVGHDWGGAWKKYVRRAVYRYFKQEDVSSDHLYWAMQGRGVSLCWVVKK